MSSINGSNLPRVKRKNRSSILEMIYRHGPISRASIARQLSLSLPTITTNVASMIDAGFVRESETSAEGTASQMGRKTYPVGIIPDSRFAIGIEWGAKGQFYCVTDLYGKVLGTLNLPMINSDYDSNVAQTIQGIRRLIDETRIDVARTIGIGICIPALVDEDKNMIRLAPIQGWQNKICAENIGGSFNLPVTLGNHAHARGISADLFDRRDRDEVFIYYFVQRGISGTLMVNGVPLKGGNSGAGDLGHTTMQVGGPLCECGRHGCLQAISSEQAIRRECVKAMHECKETLLLEICRDRTHPTMAEIIRAVDAGDEPATKIVLNAAKYLAISMASIINFSSPHTIVVDSALMDSQKAREHLLEVLHEHMYSVSKDEISIEFKKADLYSGALGAAALAVRHLFIDRGN